jgi:hypothetical protein
MDGRMPVIASVKCGRQFSWRCCIRITVQRVANVIWVLFVDASECEICKSLRYFHVELACILGGRIRREEQKRGAEYESHPLIL